MSFIILNYFFTLLRNSTHYQPITYRSFQCSSHGYTNQGWHYKPKQFPFSTLVILPKSTCFAQAKDILEWEMATKVKLDAFIHNNTWTLVPKSKNCKPIASKWLYKVNLKSDCTLDIYKCRVVAKGYKQKLCIDNYETFSLVVKP